MSLTESQQYALFDYLLWGVEGKGYYSEGGWPFKELLPLLTQQQQKELLDRSKYLKDRQNKVRYDPNA